MCDQLVASDHPKFHRKTYALLKSMQTINFPTSRHPFDRFNKLRNFNSLFIFICTNCLRVKKCHNHMCECAYRFLSSEESKKNSTNEMKIKLITNYNYSKASDFWCYRRFSLSLIHCFKMPLI